jgi:hypothetical protein
LRRRGEERRRGAQKQLRWYSRLWGRQAVVGAVWGISAAVLCAGSCWCAGRRCYCESATYCILKELNTGAKGKEEGRRATVEGVLWKRHGGYGYEKACETLVWRMGCGRVKEWLVEGQKGLEKDGRGT